MAIDASIALGIKPVQIENPLNNMAKFSSIQNDMANMALHKQKMATDAASTARQNELNNYLGSGGRDPDRIYQLGGPEALNPINQAESARITGLKASGETLDATMNRNKGILQDYVDTPKAARQWLYMQFIDPAMKATFDKLGVSFEQAAARIPDDPAEFGKWKEQSIMGMEKHLQARGVKNITPSGDRNVLTDLQGRIIGEIPIGATMQQRIDTNPNILAGIANQDAIKQQIAQGNPGGQAPVASQTNQLLNASVAQANDQTPPPISPLAANVNRQQAELDAVNAKLRADQEQALAAKQPLDAKDRRIKDYAQAIRDGRSPNDQDMKDLRLQIIYDRTHANQIRPPIDPRVVTHVTPKEDGTLVNQNAYGQVVSIIKEGGRPSAQYSKAKEQAKTLNRNVDIAIKQIGDAIKPGGLLDRSTGSGIGRGVDIGANLIGKATPGAIAAAELAPIADLAVKLVTRFEGNQSNADVVDYKTAAGQLADPTLPIEIRRAAAVKVMDIMKRRKGQFITPEMAAQGEVPAGGIAPPAGFVAD